MLPTADSLRAAVDARASDTPPDGRISLIDTTAADAYPIVNFEYAIVNPKQPNADMADQLKKFLTWVISPSGGSTASLVNSVDFVPLPDDVAAKSRQQIAKIGS